MIIMIVSFILHRYKQSHIVITQDNSRLKKLNVLYLITCDVKVKKEEEERIKAT